MNNRQFLLVVGGALILLAVGAALIWTITTTLNEIEPAPMPARHVEWTGKASLTPLQMAERQATERAQVWADDARLVKVEASWRPLPEDIDVDTPPLAWALTYYSPSKEAVTTAHVHAESFSWGKSRLMGVNVEALAPFPPPQGMKVAWLSFRAAGGEEFLAEHPGATVQFLLRKREKLLWTILAFTKEQKFEIFVDAETGLVVNKSE